MRRARRRAAAVAGALTDTTPRGTRQACKSDLEPRSLHTLPPHSLLYREDTSRPSLRTNWTCLVPPPVLNGPAPPPPAHRPPLAPPSAPTHAAPGSARPAASSGPSRCETSASSAATSSRSASIISFKFRYTPPYIRPVARAIHPERRVPPHTGAAFGTLSRFLSVWPFQSFVIQCPPPL